MTQRASSGARRRAAKRYTATSIQAWSRYWGTSSTARYEIGWVTPRAAQARSSHENRPGTAQFRRPVRHSQATVP